MLQYFTMERYEKARAGPAFFSYAWGSSCIGPGSVGSCRASLFGVIALAVSKWEYIKSRFAEIEVWLKAGLSQEQVITNLKISKTTFEKYKKAQPELSELLKKGACAQIEEVENALYKTSTGYHFYEEQAVKCKEVYYDEGGRRCEREVLKTVSIRKFHPPETAAMAFFLKNKTKGEYGDNPQLANIRREELNHRIKQDEFKDF